MKIAILGYGKEGKSVEKYFSPQHEIAIYDNLDRSALAQLDLSSFDLVFRSPSVPPLDKTWTSVTKYFFDHCPCPIIGVTGTKGKGTTSSIIAAILEKLGKKVWLVGNIGSPAIDILEKVQPDDVVVYEMSSFQLWDLTKSPHVAVILGIEPDHLNVHADYAEYLAAKSNITAHQATNDVLVYNQVNQDSADIAASSPAGTKLPYLNLSSELLSTTLDALAIPGQHNRDNATAALLAAASYLGLQLEDFLRQYQTEIRDALTTFRGLPHRLEFLRELNHVKYYDDNFCTNAASLKVALQAFPGAKIVLIAGGRDKTDNADLPEIAELIQQYADRAVLIGESGQELIKVLPDTKAILQSTLAAAVSAAQTTAEELAQNNGSAIVLMSPAAASFDMFNNAYDRGDQFKKLVRELH